MTANQPTRRPVIGRFAPSPTGALHLGSLTAALASWLMARCVSGQWLIRIEDLDPPREIPGMAEQHLSTLSAFGLTSDLPVWRQSQRSEFYNATLQRLIASGHAFECRCSRNDLSITHGVHHACVAQPSGMPAWRMRVPSEHITFIDHIRGSFEQSLHDDVGDFVLKRSDGFWAYQMAVVVDDAEQGISQIVRGADLIDSTPRQILLQRSLGLTTPHYCHLPVLRYADGSKLSKSLAAAPVDPTNPLPALRHAYALIGQDNRVLDGQSNMDQMLLRALAHFQPELIPSQDIVIFEQINNTSPR